VRGLGNAKYNYQRGTAKTVMKKVFERLLLTEASRHHPGIRMADAGQRTQVVAT
jgi:hypothetical protein